MNLRVSIIALLLALVCFREVKAQSPQNVEKLVRSYFSAFQAQEWETLVGMLHPKFLLEMRDKVLEKIPRTTDAITDKERQDVEKMLKALSVTSLENAWALPPQTVYLRMLQQGNKITAVNALKDVVTEIKDVKIEEGSGEFSAEVKVESKFKGRVFSGTSYFIVEPFEGALKVVAMTKTKNPPKDEKVDSDKTDAKQMGKPPVKDQASAQMIKDASR